MSSPNNRDAFHDYLRLTRRHVVLLLLLLVIVGGLLYGINAYFTSLPIP
jgi:hypothetical protein